MKLLLPVFLVLTLNSYGQTAKSYFKTAEKQLKDNKTELALQSIDKALTLDSTNLVYWDVKIECLKIQEKWEEMYYAYSRAIAIHPDTAYLYCNRGCLLTNIGLFDEAITDFNTGIVLVEADSLKITFLVSRSAAKMSKRDFNGAYNDLLNAYRIDSTNLGTLINLGSACDEIGRGDETMFYLLKAQALSPKNIAVIGNIGFKYQVNGDYKTSIEYFNKAASIEPQNGQVYSNRSYSYLKLGDIKNAKEDIEKAIRYYPENSYAYWVRALIYISEKNYTVACADLQTALDKGFTVRYGNEVQELKDKYCNPASNK